MISIDKVCVQFGGISLFNDVSLMISDNEKVALVGRNGAGKSTLLKLIADLEKPTKGKIVIPKNQTVGYLPQKMKLTGTQTVLKETLSAFHEVNEIEETIAGINHELATRKDYESEAYLELIHKLGDATEQLNLHGGTTILADTEQALLGLGFNREDFQKSVSTFSGGWKMRIELAKILLKKPGILLLDEPTNHLDIESIIWLENFLISYSGSVMVISHDRIFLDHVTTRTIEIYMHNFHDYPVSYSKFMEFRKERRSQLLATYQNQQKMIEKTEDFIEKFRYKATKANQVQSRIKKLDKLARIEVEKSESTIHFRFPSAPRSGNIVLEIDDLNKSFGNKEVLKGAGMIIERGEKVAFVGRNGEGKTTLVKIILGKLKADGLLKLGHNVTQGYYAQNQDELLDEGKTVLQTIDDEAKGEARSKIRDMLGSFLFTSDDIEKKVRVLSGGERSRLSLIKLLLQPVSLLILDEPTNHLDLNSKDILKEALQKYNGTLILVSHDRYFLDGLVEKVYEFRNHRIKEYMGGIFDFLENRKLDTLQQLEIKSHDSIFRKGPVSSKKNNYLIKKEYDRELRKRVRSLNEIENKIEILEGQISQFDQNLTQLSDNEDHTKIEESYRTYHEKKKQLNQLISEWEKASEHLERWKVKAPGS